MKKKGLILFSVFLFLALAFARFFYLPRANSLKLNFLEAGISSSLSPDKAEVEVLRLSLAEARSELEFLQQENYSIREELAFENEIKADLKLNYESELKNLTAEVETLSFMINDFTWQMEELNQLLDEKTEFLDKDEKEELSEKEKEKDLCSVNINTASKEELQKLAGIGPVIAQRIIDARPFLSVYDLIKVSGIGETTLQKIIDQGCAYVENDIGPSDSGPVYSFSSGGTVSSAPLIIYPKILISEIQILPIGQRFIELYNPNNYSVDLTGWYIQRKTKEATSWSSLVSSTYFNGKSIPANSYFLIARDKNLGPDILFDSLVLTENNAIVLKNPKREEVDKFGWGEASDFETAPFLENPATKDPIADWLVEIGFKGNRDPLPFVVFEQSLGRKLINNNNNYQDTNNNAEDFEVQNPTPGMENKTFLDQQLEGVLEGVKTYYNAPIETEIISGPASSTEETFALFEFQVNKEYCYFECRLNQEEWQECESPKTYEDLEAGERTFSVRAIDLFSQTDPNPPEHSWIIEAHSQEDENGDEEGEEKDKTSKNLLLNEFFEDWDNDVLVYWDDGANTGDIYQSTEEYMGMYSLGIEHSFVGDRNIEQHTEHTTAGLGYFDRAYGKIWVRGTGFIRIGIRAGQSSFYHGDWKKLDNSDWVQVTYDRISMNTEDSWKFRIQTTARVGPSGEFTFNKVDLQIGAAWLSTNEPPENWPQTQ